MTHPQAMKEKEAGNAAYKKKDFETALSHYSKAIELDPTDMTFLNNKAGMCCCLSVSLCVCGRSAIVCLYRVKAKSDWEALLKKPE